jgi:uroporphyrinogen-III decarboxylase
MDGMFTVACELRGAENICIDIYEDPDYFHTLMEYLTQSTAARLKAWRKYLGHAELTPAFSFADDSIQLLSRDTYKEMVLPYHLKLARLTSTMEERGSAHLCGDATRHFTVIRDALNVYTFDTGFPVAHKELIKELGPEVCIQGGPHAALIYAGSRDEIRAASKKILDDVKPVGKKFIFRDGNDIPPGTPLENIEALYQACKDYGQFYTSVRKDFPHARI